jgi:hypothetical protein
MGSGCIAPQFLNLITDGGEWSASRPGPFTSEKGLPVPIGWEAGGPQSRSGHCGEEKNLFLLLGIEPQPSSP